MKHLGGFSISGIRQSLDAQRRAYIFRGAVRRFMREPGSWSHLDGGIIRDLIRGWGNEAWSASNEYMTACIEQAVVSDGPILECGSGLTTIILGIIAQSMGHTLWSLEHQPEWGKRVQVYLNQYEIRSVHLCVQPLKEYDSFGWYDAPLELMPEFSLVICDGPPADTRAGRYGLLPVMRTKLRPGAVILLDDAGREQERAVATRWASELQTDHRILGSTQPYIELTIPGTR